MVYGAGMTRTVGEIARLAGITVRTLHHYDEIGLLNPSGRSDAGYRLYDADDIARLQQILFYRELEVPLDELRRILADPAFRRGEALRHQRDALTIEAERLHRLIGAVEKAIDAEGRGITMNTEEMLEVFGGFDPSEHENDVRRRWGHTDAYQESALRTSQHTKQDWELLGREADEIDQAFLALMVDDAPADGNKAMLVAERHRSHISKWFYECTPATHRGLGEMYVADSRFTENIDRAGAGLAEFMAAAIRANAERPTG